MYPRVECAWSHPQIQSPPDESQGNGTKPDKQVRSWQRQHVRPPNLSQPQKVGRQWLRRAKPLKGSAPHPPMSSEGILMGGRPPVRPQRGGLSSLFSSVLL